MAPSIPQPTQSGQNHLHQESFAAAVVNGTTENTSVSDWNPEKDASAQPNGLPNKGDSESTLIVEDLQDRDGERLTSIKFEIDNDPQKPVRTQTELISGRRAGANWEKSRSVVQPDTHSSILC